MVKNEFIWKHVEEVQKDFEYKQILDSGDYSIWYCGRKGTSIYSFEIFLGCRGIAVVGDIDPLIFRVARGLNFLAGDDIDYYIHSKLDHVFLGRVDLDVKGRDNYLMEEMRNYIEDNLDIDTKEINTLPDMSKIFAENGFMDSPLGELYEDIKDETDLEEVFKQVYDYDSNAEYSMFTKPTDSVVFPLYMVCYAARKIMAGGLEIPSARTN